MALPNAIGIGFHLPELILESIIRDGFQNVVSDPSIIDYVFNELTRAYNLQKYGQTEITKIKALVTKPIAVVYSYAEVDAKSPCYSIMLGSDDEDKKRAHLGDYYEFVTEPITNSGELAALIHVNNMIVTSYDPNSGLVSVVDGTDLSNVYQGLEYVDSVGTTHELIGGINDIPGQKGFFISKQETVDFHLSNGQIKSQLNFHQFEVRGFTSDIKLVVGCHSKDVLTTKYLYILLKYFIFSRKNDMISRGLYVSSFNGSDFIRDAEYQGDMVYTRFLTISGKIDDTWRADQVELIDNVTINAVPIDEPESDDPNNQDPPSDD